VRLHHAVALVVLAGLITSPYATKAQGSATLSEKPFPSMQGLDAAADAERFADASDHENADLAHQKAIEAYGDCLADPTLGPLQHSILSVRQGHERIALAEDFIAAGRLQDAHDQVFRTGIDLLDACKNMDRLSGSDQTDLRILVAPFYLKYGAQLGMATIESIRTDCQPLM
jgi:hypothetical protein